MMKARHLIIILFAALSLAGKANAQCAAENTAFKAGEELNYDLFFNWKFVWVSAGTATMSIKQTNHEGKPAYRAHLITRTSTRLDRFFMMRDTMLSIVTEDMAPRYYKKSANEGGRYYVDEVWYSYSGGKVHLRQYYRHYDGRVTDQTCESPKCAYDMLSALLRARSFKVDNLKKGEKLHMSMADGHKIEEITLIYRGKKSLKLKSNDQVYPCLVFSFVEYPNGKEKEIITFFVSDDANHIPVRLDLNLRFGVAKAYLNNAKGLRH